MPARDPMPHLFSWTGAERKQCIWCVETFKCTHTYIVSPSWKYNHLHAYMHFFLAHVLSASHTNTQQHTHQRTRACHLRRHKPHNKSQTLADHTALSCGENKGYSYPSQWEVCTANSLSPSLPRLSPQLFITDNLRSQTFHFSAIVRFLIIFISP